MTAAFRSDSVTPTAMQDSAVDPRDTTRTGLATVDTRRNVLRRSLRGLTGIGLTALITGCGWGEDDDEPDTADPEVIEGDGGLDGAEGEEGDIPGEEPDPESGV